MKFGIQKNSINNLSKEKMTLSKEVTKKKDSDVTLVRLVLTKRKERGLTAVRVVVMSSSSQKTSTQT